MIHAFHDIALQRHDPFGDRSQLVFAVSQQHLFVCAGERVDLSANSPEMTNNHMMLAHTEACALSQTVEIESRETAVSFSFSCRREQLFFSAEAIRKLTISSSFRLSERATPSLAFTIVPAFVSRRFGHDVEYAVNFIIDEIIRVAGWRLMRRFD
jgi:hypothetical protein